MAWKTVSNKNVRHIWKRPSGEGEEVAVDPSFYGESGTPVCDDSVDDGCEGDDMVYDRTEVNFDE
jgi:hypothetical protein